MTDLFTKELSTATTQAEQATNPSPPPRGFFLAMLQSVIYDNYIITDKIIILLITSIKHGAQHDYPDRIRKRRRR